MTKRKVVNVSRPIDAPVSGTSALKPHAHVNNIKPKQKVKVLKREYVKPKAKIVSMSTQKSPVMGCWDCGEDGMHC